MSITNEQIVEALSQKKLSEIMELISQVELRFGVTAAAAAPAASTEAEAAPVEEKTEFDVILKGVSEGKNRLDVIRALKRVFGTELGLKEVKEMVENAPVTIRNAISKEAAENLKKELSESGAIIEVN